MKKIIIVFSAVVLAIGVANAQSSVNIANETVYVASFTANAATGVIKTGTTFLKAIIIGDVDDSGKGIELFDTTSSTSATTRRVAINSKYAGSYNLNLRISNGLYVVKTGTAPIVVIYK